MKTTICIFFFSVLAILQSPAQILHQRHLPTAQDLLQALDTYHTSAVRQIDPDLIKPGINVTDSVKQKLLELLKDSLTGKEMKTLVENDFIANFEPRNLNRIRDRATFLADQRHTLFDPIYRSIYDSMAAAFKELAAQRIKDAHVPDEIIMAAAAADIREAIPLLEKDLQSSGPHRYNTTTAELSLARLGNKSLQEKWIRTAIYNPELEDNPWRSDLSQKAKMLLFIHTQESIYQLRYWMDTTKLCALTSSGKTVSYCAVFAISYLLGTIRNKDFQEPFRFASNPWASADTNTGRQVIACKEWLIKNKGKYDLD